jgi:hypothetical protein
MVAPARTNQRSGDSSCASSAAFRCWGFKFLGPGRGAGIFAGVESEARPAPLLPPGNHGFEDRAGDSATAVARFGVDIEDGGAAVSPQRMSSSIRRRRRTSSKMSPVSASRMVIAAEDAEKVAGAVGKSLGQPTVTGNACRSGVATRPVPLKIAYLFESSLASFTFAASSFCWTLAKASVSCSAGTVLFHSWTARSQ